ncbi:MAG: ribosomal protein L7/L12 [Thermoanaerobaculia bacterium]
MNVVLAAIAAIVAIWLIDRAFRARTQTLRDEGMLPPAGEGSEADVERLVAAGHKIAAIKLHREIHGSGLKEAKEAVDALARSLRTERPS